MKSADISRFEPSKTTTQDKRVLDEVVKALESLRFGSVEITVHEGRVTQIERKEKVRFS
jgi:hypothetical protein